MMFPTEPDRWTLDIATAGRVEAVAAFGVTERQAQFLVHALLHAGVFVERQYCQFAHIVHGQKSADFVRMLVERRWATPVATGPLHRGRLFHLHYKPLWAAIGEPDNRFRKATTHGRLIERVMLLDAVLDEPDLSWLGPAIDKRRHFQRALAGRLDLRAFPHLTFHGDGGTTTRLFPDKLPIGVEPHGRRHVLLYLVTGPSAMDFRLFLLRHTELLRALYQWEIRLLVPRPLVAATTAYLRAARDHLASPLDPAVIDELKWFFPEQERLAQPGAGAPDARLLRDRSAYRAPQFTALYRHWLLARNDAFWCAGSPTLADAIDRGEGQVECVPLTRQYLHLSNLVGVA